MPVSEYHKCKLAERIEPFGTRADYLQASIIAAQIVNFSLNRDSKSKPVTNEFFMPRFDDDYEELRTPELKPINQLQMMHEFARIHNASLGIANA